MVLLSLVWMALVGRAVELPAVPVSAHFQAMTVSQALNLIGKKAGVALSADDSLKSDVVLIRVQAKPLKELGKQLGMALDADWAASGKGFVLSRSADSVKKEEESQLKFESAAFGRAQAALKQVDDSYGAWGPDSAKALTKQMVDAQANPASTPAELRQIANRTPLMRLFIRVLAALPPDDLAKMPPWGRAVYTVRPNHVQRPMPADAVEAMLAYKGDQAIWSTAAEAFSNLKLSEGLESAQPFRSDPAKVYLALYRGEGPKLQAELRVVDSAGFNLAGTKGEIGPAASTDSLPALPDANSPVLPSQLSVALYQAIKSKEDIRRSGNESVLKPLIQDPETVDPLATLPTDVIDGVTDHIAPNLVAVVPDDAYSLFDLPSLDGLSKGDAWSALGDLGFQGIVDGSWLRLTAGKMAASHEQRLDRSLLAKLLKSVPDGPTHIEFIEEVADSPGGITRTPLLMDDLQLWSHSLHDQVAGIDWIAARTLGCLTPAQQASLLAGDEIHVLELSSYAQKCVQELIDRGLFSDPKSTWYSIAILPLQDIEPTNILTEGIGNDAVLVGKYVSTPLASVAPPSGRSGSDDDKRVPLSDVLTDLGAGTPVEYGMSYKLDLKVQMYPSLFSGGTVTENFYMGLAKAAADLPADYARAIRRYQKN